MVRRPADDDMDATGAAALAVLWSSEAHELDQIAAQLEFPQLARLARDLCDCAGAPLLAKGRLVKLHGLKTFPKVELAAVADRVAAPSSVGGGGGERLLLPVGSCATVQVLPFRDKDHVYGTVGDLIGECPRPKAVVVNKKITLYEKNYAINVGETLVISSVDKRCTSAGVVDFLLCRHHEKMIGLPATCCGSFTAVPDETGCTVKDLGKTCEFPQRVRFAGGLPPPPPALGSQQQAAACGGGAGAEYIAQGIVRRQYLVCTDAGGGEQDRVYFVPLAVGPANGKGGRVHLPQTRDAAVRRILETCCENLSMKHVVDCTPLVERSHSGLAFARTFSEAYDAPVLSSVAEAAAARQPVPGYFASPGHVAAGYEESHYATPGVPRQVTGSSRPYDVAANRASSGGASEVVLSSAATQLGRAASFAGGRPELSKSVSFGGASTARSSSIKKSKRSAIGSAVTRLLLSPSSSDEEDTAASATAATSGVCQSAATPPPTTTATLSSALPKPVGKTKPIMKLPRAPPETATVKELWTPPCSPDYRDHTTTTAVTAFSALLTVSSAEPHPPVYSMPLPKVAASTMMAPAHSSQATAAVPRSGAPTMLPPATVAAASPDVRARRRGSFAPLGGGSGALDGDCAAFKLSLAQSVGGCCPKQQQQPQPSHLQHSSSGSRPPSALSVTSGASSSSGHGSCADSTTDVSCSPMHDRRGGGDHRRSASADSSIATLADVPDDWSGLSVTALCACLRLHELHAAAEKLRQQQVDGQFFMMMTEAMFRDQAFGLSDFEVLKIRRLQSGWRPKIK